MKNTLSSGRNLFQKADIGIISVFLFVSIAVWSLFFVGQVSAKPQSAALEIYSDGKLIDKIPLSAADQPFSLCGGRVTVRLNDGRAGFVYSDCADQMCVRTGYIRTPGETAVCLPNRVVLQIVGNEGANPDAVAG